MRAPPRCIRPTPQDTITPCPTTGPPIPSTIRVRLCRILTLSPLSRVLLWRSCMLWNAVRRYGEPNSRFAIWRRSVVRSTRRAMPMSYPSTAGSRRVRQTRPSARPFSPLTFPPVTTVGISGFLGNGTRILGTMSPSLSSRCGGAVWAAPSAMSCRCTPIPQATSSRAHTPTRGRNTRTHSTGTPYGRIRTTTPLRTDPICTPDMKIHRHQ